MLKPVPDEHIRLWRGIVGRPDGDVGEYFTVYRDDALEYTLDEEGQSVEVSTLFYLDIPIETALPFRSVGRARGEFILPRELANTAKIVVDKV